ncbi:hypothetical protein [Phytopseudomonas daroniae]|uniref:hypothetical protein n=1 Tax=Phytopseudomonas daroniae TaxID=2487519 RepID=UPI001038480F|nr:hypothetical protein [Pseudomonas daroniae]TBU75228.1 hypothetical protein DNK10_11275 [Pseudomonas daroniae]
MTDFLDTECPQCQTPLLEIETSIAAHDPRLIDVVVRCLHCDYTLNAFISLDEMTVLSNAAAGETQP